MLKKEQSSSFNTYIPMTLVQKREKAESSVQTCAKSDIERFFDLRFAASVRTIASSAKLDILKVDETQIVEISWETSD